MKNDEFFFVSLIIMEIYQKVINSLLSEKCFICMEMTQICSLYRCDAAAVIFHHDRVVVTASALTLKCYAHIKICVKKLNGKIP